MVKEALAAEAPAPGMVPPGLRIYAVGDVHGCAGRLGRLHARIAQDAVLHPAARTAIVHLGDYVDRGADSAGVLQRLLGPPPVPGAAMVNLMGNHEAMMLEACEAHPPPGAVALWLENGGVATLASYGGRAAIPPTHLALLRGCALHWSAGDYLFVHAGIRPGLPLERQDPLDLLWIREPFLSHDGALPRVVVHGHTPMPAPVVRPQRIGIDTGACFGGELTCLVLEGRRLRFLAA